MSPSSRRALSLATLVLVAGVASARAEEQRLHVFTLLHRQAEEIVSLVRPLVGAAGHVTASGSKLIVHADPERFAAVERLVRELDVAPRSLWITVEQQHDTSESSRASGLSGASAGGAQAGSSPGESRAGTRVERRTRRSVVTGAFAAQQADSTASLSQRLRALEGRPAFIAIGEARPVATAAPFFGPGADTLVATGTQYQASERGFYVTPFVSGDVVTLEISVSGDRVVEGGGVELQRLGTTAAARLGEWLSLATIAGAEQRGVSTPLSRSGALREELVSIRVRVDEAR